MSDALVIIEHMFDTMTRETGAGSREMERLDALVMGEQAVRLEVLAEIGSLYLDAGAEILTTNTFGGSPLKLKHYSLDEKTEEIRESSSR